MKEDVHQIFTLCLLSTSNVIRQSTLLFVLQELLPRHELGEVSRPDMTSADDWAFKANIIYLSSQVVVISCQVQH